MDRRWLITFVTLLLLWWVVATINHHLAPYGASLFVGGLLVTSGALRLQLRSGLVATLLVGLAIDAVEPVPAGTHLLLFGTMHVLLFQVRTRFPREEVMLGVVAALFANLGLFLGVSLVVLGRHPAPGAAWLRLFADLGWSQLFLVAIAPWFFALQRRALELGRVDLVEEHRQSF
jgi:rod shape-determining protein MreD